MATSLVRLLFFLSVLPGFAYPHWADAACTIPSKPAGAIDITSYGATGSDGSDDTTAIQNAINATPASGTLYVPAGQYRINASDGQGLLLKSNMTMLMETGAILEAIPNANEQYAVVTVKYPTSNVIIAGGTIRGERDFHSGTTGELGHLLNILSSSYISVRGTTFDQAWGDGIHIGAAPDPGTASTNITICNVTANDNRRNGLSVVHADKVLVETSTFSNSNGTPPEAGIDLEPNSGQSVSNVTIRSCSLTGNGSGTCFPDGGGGCQGAGWGLYTLNLTSGTNKIEISTIKNNINEGIRVNSSTGFKIYRNLIQNNACNPNLSPRQLSAIRMHNSTSSIIEKNTVRDCTTKNMLGILMGTGLTAGSNIFDNDICVAQQSDMIFDLSSDHAYTQSANTYCTRTPHIVAAPPPPPVTEGSNLDYLFLLLKDN